MSPPYSIPPLLSLIGYGSLAVYLYLKAPRNRTTRLFIGICILSAFLYLDILYAFNTTDPVFALWVSRIDHLFIAFLIPLYIHFFHDYLSIDRPRWLIPAAYGMAILLMCLAPSPWYIPAMTSNDFGFFAKAGPLYALFGLCGIGVAVYVSFRVYQAVQSERDRHRKKQLWFIFAGVGGLGVLNGLNFFPIHGVTFYPPGNFGFIPMIVVAYGLFRHNLFNTNAFINRSLVYSFITACLTCLYALIVTIITKFFNGVDYSKSYIFSFLFFLLVALIFGPLKNRIQRVIDRIFFRRAYDYRLTIKGISQMIVSVLDMEQIGQTITKTVKEAMQVETCRLVFFDPGGSNALCFGNQENSRFLSLQENKDRSFIRNLMDKQSPIIRGELLGQPIGTEQQTILNDMAEEQVDVAVPFVFKGHVNGYLLLGPKCSGERFSREDVDLLETLSGQSALALENAHSYKRVEILNQELEGKVAARTNALKLALLEKERAQEKLIRSESLASIGQLVAGVAHELNNPLASTVSLLQTAIEDLEALPPETSPDKDTIHDLRYADRELWRARRIVTSLLGLSRQTDSFYESVSINSVVRDALCIIQNQYKSDKVMLVERLEEDLPTITGNFSGLGQVVMNIVLNAFQAMPNQNAIVEVITRYDQELNRVIFSCKDTGPGILPSIRNDIFKPFFTTKEPGKGTGLGLYISYEIVRKHGGDLYCTDHDGGGAEFTVMLPVDSA